MYEVSFGGGLTGIGGDEEVIVLAQRGSERYLQRPDADYVQVDSSALPSLAVRRRSRPKRSVAPTGSGISRRPGVPRGHLQRHRASGNRRWDHDEQLPDLP